MHSQMLIDLLLALAEVEDPSRLASVAVLGLPYPASVEEEVVPRKQLKENNI